MNLTDCNVGSRKRRNVRDNLFVINAIMNPSKQNLKEALDVSVYDVIKCFDSLWVQECIIDMYDAGVRNDKLNVLHLLNQNALVAVKTSSGLSERRSISNVIMQGTVLGGMFCTTTVDKLGKYKYENPDSLYMYKGVVGVPALEIVDDIIDIQKCGVNAVKSSALIKGTRD
jgi:hypothetical protein